MYRKTYALINNDILENNVKKIKEKYNEYKYYIGVVKNNAYNHGIHIINSIIKGGINYLAVSSLDEALEIRKYYIDIPILILEPIDLEDTIVASKNDITIAVDNLDYVKKLNGLEFKNKLKIHMIIDSGMNRLGLKDKDEINEVEKIIKSNDKLYLEGLFTHFATSGFKDEYYDIALEKVYELISDLDIKNIPIIHFARSLTLERHPKCDYTTGIRLGILMYGYNSNISYSDSFKDKLRMLKREKYLKKNNISESILDSNLAVEPAFSLYTKVISIRHAKKGEIVGYEASYKCEEDAVIATLPVGYADGVNKNYGDVVINNKRYKIISDCMDMIMVLVDEDVKIDDEVEIFGNIISPREVCQNLGVNAYHLYSLISNRVPRVHIENKEKSEVKY